jgi:rhamnulokinase
MARDSKFLAFDFGAESGRALLGVIEDDKLDLAEIHRFHNGPVSILGHMHWDILRQFTEVKHGLRIALQQTGGKIDGIGVDTWGVDFSLFGEDGEMLMNPFHYRDSRTDGMMDEVFAIVPKREVFETTGNQFMQLNSLYQLYSMVKSNATALKSASKLLMMPDIFNYWLTGKQVGEFTIASTSQCFDPRKGDWARGMLDTLGIPSRIMPEIVQPGTVIAPLADALVKQMGSGAGIPVIATGCHDTASAVAAVPATGHNHAYLSSGTWSLMGVELKEPMISDHAYEKNFTNEGGVAGTIRFLHNIMGLWIVQECKRTWASQGEDLTYGQITEMAAAVADFPSVIDPDSTDFLAPGDMPTRIKAFCERTRQRQPESKGEIVRCVLNSLALRYRATIEDLDTMLGIRHDPIHIVGGGTQNTLLSQLTADATGRRVVAGPVEATAIGNVLVQAIARGFVSSIDEARSIVRNSFELTRYEPRPSESLEAAYRTFKDLPS